MRDRYNREIDYLRISVTDLCNYRCQYCMPSEGIEKKCHNEILSFERIEQIVRVAAKYGIKKLRLTGGEPLVRRDIASLCRSLKSIDGIEEICMTTNATLLKSMAKELKASGVDRLNISIDTLDPDKYR